jgi:hypothetical protein
MKESVIVGLAASSVQCCFCRRRGAGAHAPPDIAGTQILPARRFKLSAPLDF